MTGVEELRQLIGRQGEPVVVEVERGMLRRIAEAIEDPNPLWQDEEFARRTRFGGVIAPPAFFFTAFTSGAYVPVPKPSERVVAGGGEWEFYLPVRPGDVITTTSRFAGVLKKKKGVLLVFEFTHRNQKDELVGQSRTSLISY